MLQTVLPRLGNKTATGRWPCGHPLSLSSLLSGQRTSDGVATSEASRKMSENASGGMTPPFQYFWQPGSGYYGKSLGRLTQSITDCCEGLVLSHLGM